jgi:alkyl hydroperoxide reductase subunit AhpC
MRKLSERFPAGGDVVIVGVHTPELEVERDPAAVRRAVTRLGLRYPVVIDGRMAIWRAFGNEYWPALYLIDRRGLIRETHIGELHEGTPAWDALLAKIEALRREAAPTG